MSTDFLPRILSDTSIKDICDVTPEEFDLHLTITPITTVSRPMRPLPPDCVMKLCRPCGVGFYMKKEPDVCPFCKTPFQEKE